MIREETLANPESEVRSALDIIAESFRYAVAARGRFLLALRGGVGPWQMRRLSVEEEVQRTTVHLLQRVSAQGVIWNVDSFDQLRAKLGKAMAQQLVPAVECADETRLAHASSTNTLTVVQHDRQRRAGRARGLSARTGRRLGEK